MIRIVATKFVFRRAESLMSWDYLVWFFIGAICAVRLPILPFTLVAVVGIACYAFTLIGSGNPATTIALWCVFYAASLQAGYFFAHFLLYLIYVKIGGRDRKRRSPLMKSKYSPD